MIITPPFETTSVPFLDEAYISCVFVFDVFRALAATITIYLNCVPYLQNDANFSVYFGSCTVDLQKLFHTNRHNKSMRFQIR